MAKARVSKKAESKQSETNLTPPAVSGGSNGLSATTAVAAPAIELTKAAATTTENLQPVKETRKTSVVRIDSRATLVPVDLKEEIRRLAYLFSERRGFEPGHETEDWLMAEHEIRERFHQPSA